MKILLISGHGAGDPGATGNGFQEANLTRELVNLIAPKLRKYATVDIYNQSRNAFKDCQAGTFSIGAYDYVLEVHFNAFNGQAYGTEIYVTDREKGVTVEQAIMNEMGTYFVKRGSTGVKVTNFLVINTVKSKGISSALLETCFIDNTNDMRIYQANKDKIAQAITNGIITGFGLGTAEKPAEVPAPAPAKKTVDELAREVINGYWGNGQDRINKLKNAGYDATAVQNKVNEILGVGSTKSIETIAKEVIQGKWGNGSERKQRLQNAGYDYNQVQAKVNQLLS